MEPELKAKGIVVFPGGCKQATQARWHLCPAGSLEAVGAGSELLLVFSFCASQGAAQVQGFPLGKASGFCF